MALMPRAIAYSPLSAAAFNQVSIELENMGRTCRTRRTSAMSVPSGVNTVVTWQSEDFDTNGGGMWDVSAANYQTIQVAGTYDILAQTRWDDLGGSGSAYWAGLRNAFICVNGTDPTTAACKANNSADATRSVSGRGATIQTSASEALQPGDRVYLVVSQDCGSTITGCHQDYGGTFMKITRTSAIA